MSAADADHDVAAIPPAPGDVEANVAERAATEFAGHRSMTLVGGFGLEDDHLPFPLVRRRETDAATKLLQEQAAMYDGAYGGERVSGGLADRIRAHLTRKEAP